MSNVGGAAFTLNYLVGLNSWIYNTWAVLFILLQSHNFVKIKNIQVCLIFLLSDPVVLPTPFFRLVTLPLSLWIGTINWHPPLFYCVIITYASLQIKKNLAYLTTLIKVSHSSQIKLLSVTLLLGGLWGLQSLTWGYFWVNDGIEWSLLIVILLIIVHQHHFEYRYATAFCVENLSGVLVTLVLLRLNLLPTRHAFLISTPVIYKLIFIYFFAGWSRQKNYIEFLKKKYQRPSLLNYILYLTVLLFVCKPWAALSFKLLMISLVLNFFYVIPSIAFQVKKFVLHYILLGLLAIWTMTYAMFTLLFINKKNIHLTPTTFYKLTYTSNLQIISQKNLLKTLLEKVSMYSNLNVHTPLSLAPNLTYALICINTLEFLLLLFCLLL